MEIFHIPLPIRGLLLSSKHVSVNIRKLKTQMSVEIAHELEKYHSRNLAEELEKAYESFENISQTIKG